MVKYFLAAARTEQHVLCVRIEIPVSKGEAELKVQLPRWRPGRYELANYAANLRKLRAEDELGTSLEVEQLDRHAWNISTGKNSKVYLSYEFYADVVDAGSTFVGSQLFYVNPVNCLLYLPEKQDVQAEIILDIPKNYQVVSGLKKKSRLRWEARDVQQLMDCPILASDCMQRLTYQENGITFNLWFQGECKLDEQLLLHDFKRFTRVQLELFGSFPEEEYHFMFIILPRRAYHGVEHENSTMIVLGPTYHLMKKELYPDLLGVSCHELFHTWNIKKIRPKEMLPYDFTRENYSNLGYVAEGVTTYYGDQLLLRSEVFSDSAYWALFAKAVQRHADNFGRFNASVASSSFNTWIDGYTVGKPERKVSIYNEGCLLAFCADVMLLAGNKQTSLDDVMRSLYQNFALKDKGFSESDYMDLIQEFSDKKSSRKLKDHLYKSGDYLKWVASMLKSIGYALIKSPQTDLVQKLLGIKLDAKGKVHVVHPESVLRAFVQVGDVVTHINGNRIEKNLGDWLAYYQEGEALELQVEKNTVSTSIPFKLNKSISLFPMYKVEPVKKPSKEQQALYRIWKYRKA